MALYLKYRPQSFADVVGQDHIVTTMEQAVARGQISHAYLLSGTRGTGKTSVARILAKTILLQGIENDVIRGQITTAVEDGSLIDLIEIDAASNRRIDDVRDLIEKVGFTPSISRAKVYIVDEVHMLTKEAFNALLKTLEEPPEYAYFILATTELHKVPDTIQSRCQRFLFRKVKDDDIVSRLQYIVDQEHIKIDREALRAIARHAGGSFRDGISLLDQLRSLPSITLTDVSERLGNSVGTFVDDLLSAITHADHALAFTIVEAIENASIPLDLIASELLGSVRDEMHRAMDKAQDIAPFIRRTNTLVEALKNMRMSPVPAVIFESALFTLCHDTGQTALPPTTKKVSEPVTPKKDLQKEKVIQETQRAISPASLVETTVQTPPRTPSLIEAEELSLQTVFRHWHDLVATVTPPSVRMSLKNGTAVAVTNDTITIGFPSSFHKDRVAETKASRTIEEILQNIFKRPIRIKCVLDKESTSVRREPDMDLASAAAEVFGGI